MNYLKKKLKLNHKAKADDDDDYDSYIPVVPPHPSTLSANSAHNTHINSSDIQQPNGDPTQTLPVTGQTQQTEVNAEELLKELKEKEFIRRQEEKQQILIQEKEKQNREDWQFFLSLTAKVEDITNKTQSTLEKLKDTSAVDEISNQIDDGLEYVPQPDVVVVKSAGQWVAFSEDGQQPSNQQTDPDINSDKQKPTKTPQQITEESLKKVAKEVKPETINLETSNLLDDFGFNKEPEVIPVAYQPVVFEEEDYLDDPFDTSFVNVSTVAPKAAAELILSKSNVKKLLKTPSNPEIFDIDPFDTSYVDTAVSGQSVVKPNSIDISPIETPQTLPDYSQRISRCSSRDSIMSNPFLQDYNDYYTPYASGAHSPHSGTATPKRRNSTNPFEESPEEEVKNVVSSGQSPVASAIADMTADFCNAISANSYEISEAVVSKTIATAKQMVDTTVSQPFDPFATIHDDETPKRQSVTDDITCANKVISPQEDPFTTHVIHTPESPIAPIDQSFLKAINDQNSYYLSDLSDNEESADKNINNFTNNTNNTGDDINNSTRRRSSAFQMELLSGDKDLPAPTFEPIPTTNILKRKTSLPIQEPPEELIDIANTYDSSNTIPQNQYFDPFQTVFDKDPEEDVSDALFSTQPIDSQQSQISMTESLETNIRGRLSTQDSIQDSGYPNKDAVGIVNDAFDEVLVQDFDEVLVQDFDEVLVQDLEQETGIIEPAVDRDISVVHISGDDYYGGIEADNSALDSQTSDTTNALLSDNITADATTNAQTFGATTDSGVAVVSIQDDITDCGKDPFDTSDFDSAAFDAFANKFESSGTADNSVSSYDPFASPLKSISSKQKTDESDTDAFDIFDPFSRSSMKAPKNTPAKGYRDASKDSFDDEDSDNLKIVIRAKVKENISDQKDIKLAPPPLLPPPPKSPKFSTLEGMDLMPEENEVVVDEFEAFFGGGQLSEAAQAVRPIGGDQDWPTVFGEAASKRADSTESPQTPLFDDDTSVPLEEFPAKYEGEGWEMVLRYPNKKKLTANRCWKKIYVKFLTDSCIFQLFNKVGDNNPFQETPLQASYSLSDISTQQYDQYGKIFTIKLQYIFYRERVGVRPGQIAKVMQGQITSMGQFAKLGMPLEHSPQVSELFKLGSHNYNDLQQMQQVVEEALFRMTIHRDRALTYKTEEIQCAVQDELYVEQNKMGIITKQLARVRIFFLAFVNGMPVIEVGINDLKRQGKEVVGRHDIIPVVTEEWIRLEAMEFHCCVQPEDFDLTRIIKLIPPDACHFELMRFRIRPPRNRELPLQVTANMNITKSKVEIKCDVLVPGCISRKHGQIPCEDIQIRFHIPECWIYFFRVEKHFRYGALKSVNRRAGKVKGIERLLGTTQNPDPQMIEVTAGQAKYEHAFHSIVWRIPRLPKEGQGAYTQQFLVVTLPLTSFDQMPESFYEYVHIEFHMPSTTVSHTTLRSISVSNENPPEKFVRYLAKYEYKIDLNVTYDEEKEPMTYTANVHGGSAPVTGRKLSIDSENNENSADNKLDRNEEIGAEDSDDSD
ncbi:uncharacterized protein LOC128958791 [Oppia nitens]|uniref:uncharacterized protein LOC128958791 n=1 Tax=Oppia nitens TaxID=1686743 RepID=UPI0023DAEE30|nr:uncharacterized protein LOC128958791 [Oppia nitens]